MIDWDDVKIERMLPRGSWVAEIWIQEYAKNFGDKELWDFEWFDDRERAVAWAERYLREIPSTFATCWWTVKETEDGR